VRFSSLNQQLTGQKQVETARFEDPVADKTEWTSLAGIGASFCTHKLVSTGSKRIEFRVSIGARLLFLTLLVLGLTATAAFISKWGSKGTESFATDRGLIISGLLFTSVGSVMYYLLTAPIVFDKPVGFFWRGRKSPERVSDISAIKHLAQLDVIHALQLVSSRWSNERGAWRVYEVNLVLGNGDRLHVVGHGNVGQMRNDAEILSEFLDVPLWDAI
jgi:hypothetical protein